MSFGTETILRVLYVEPSARDTQVRICLHAGLHTIPGRVSNFKVSAFSCWFSRPSLGCIGFSRWHCCCVRLLPWRRQVWCGERASTDSCGTAHTAVGRGLGIKSSIVGGGVPVNCFADDEPRQSVGSLMFHVCRCLGALAPNFENGRSTVCWLVELKKSRPDLRLRTAFFTKPFLFSQSTHCFS